jgi:hypothetical protein
MARGQEFRVQLNGLLKSGLTNRAMLAERCGVSISTVQHHIPASQKRTGRYTTGRSIRLTSSEKAIIEGGILGDGRLIQNPRGAAFSFSNNKRDLIDWVGASLNRLVESNPRERYVQSRPVNHSNGTFRFQTATWKDLAIFESSWYECADEETMRRQPWRHYRKRIPEGFRLTPLSGLLWYLGDGYLVQKSTRETSQVIRFATHDLPLSGLVGTLIPQLVRILRCERNEIATHRDKRVQGYPEYGFEICIPARYVPRWLQFIGPCPESVTSYRYKWAYRDERVRKRWLKDELDFLQEYWGRLHHDKICAALNVSYEQARYAAQKRCGLHRAYSNSGKPLQIDGGEQRFRKDLHRFKSNLSRPPIGIS